MIGIYKITSPSKKIYIGQSVNIQKRFYTYSLLHCKKQPFLFNSLKKHGVENHVFEVIEECEVQKLNERERFWQDFYNVLDNGLNLVLTNCNNKSGLLHNEVVIKMTKSRKKTFDIKSFKRAENIKKGIYTQNAFSKLIKVSRARVNQMVKSESLDLLIINGATLVKIQ